MRNYKYNAALVGALAGLFTSGISVHIALFDNPLAWVSAGLGLLTVTCMVIITAEQEGFDADETLRTAEYGTTTGKPTVNDEGAITKITVRSKPSAENSHFNLTPVWIKGVRMQPSDCSHFICKKCGQRVERGAFNVMQHTDNCPADIRQIASVFHAIIEEAWRCRWTLDKYDKAHVTLRRTVTSGKDEVMNVYWNTKEEAYTVQTTVNHPKTGRKQLNRRGLSQQDVFKLLEHPRAHTDKGYYKK
jgi:hypothetical protein